jgi:hypothetical protein
MNEEEILKEIMENDERASRLIHERFRKEHEMARQELNRKWHGSPVEAA